MTNNQNNKPENLENKEKESVEPQKEKVEKEVARNEMDELRSDVDNVSQELKTAVSELKKSIVDIRSAVSEIENPFNLLRVISSEKDVKKLNSQRMPPGVKSLTLGKNEKRILQKEEPEEKPEEELSSFEEKRPLGPQPPGLRSSAETQPEIEVPPQQKIRPQYESQLPKAGSGYLDWVWSLLGSGLSSDDILQLANSYEFMGYLPAKSYEYIHSLAIACEKARSKSLAKSQLLLNMYKAAAISGIRISSGDVEELISIAEGKLKKANTLKRKAE
jgi:hypothetical protein